MAMLPNPMIAPRSILLEPVLADDGVQRLVQDCEPGQCLLFADHERRVDPDRGRVRHCDQAAPQALLVQRLGDGDRKSTRLNSSHGYISYAVFCLKKKKDRAMRRTSTRRIVTRER